MAWKAFAAAGAATAAAAVAGGIGADVTSEWYARLDRPSWQPPGEVIGAVWTALYASIAASAGQAMSRAEPGEQSRLGALLGLNLGLNAAWPWVFFRARRPELGVVMVGALEVSTLALIKAAARSDRRAAVGLLPYAGWNLFALTLNAAIVRRNPDAIGGSTRRQHW